MSPKWTSLDRNHHHHSHDRSHETQFQKVPTTRERPNACAPDKFWLLRRDTENLIILLLFVNVNKAHYVYFLIRCWLQPWLGQWSVSCCDITPAFCKPEDGLVRIWMKIMSDYEEDPMFKGIAFWARVRLFFQFKIGWEFFKIIFHRIVMEHKWQPS